MFTDNLITRFENGFNNRPVGDIFNSLPQPDPTRLHEYYDEFNVYTAANYVETETGAGGTVASADGNGGRVLITTDVLDDDAEFVQSVSEIFLFATGRKAFFRALLQVSEATQSDFIMGLQIRDTTPLDVTDGVFFRKFDASANIDFVAEKDNVQVAASAIATAVAAEDLELAFYWDGISRIWYGVNGSALGFIDPGTSLPDDEELTVSFGYQNGVAGAETMTVDYVYAAMER